MISRLRGELIEIGADRVVVDAGGVGYEVSIPQSVSVQLPGLGERVDLYVRQIVRETELMLYGFLDAEQRRLFDLLTEVKGCGPRTSQSVLSELGVDGAASAIVQQDVKMLTRASGVGPRLAERIIVELKDKIQTELLYRKVAAATTKAGITPTKQTGSDLVEALLALGYRRIEAENAAAEVGDMEGSIEDQVKAALGRLRR